MRKAFKSSTTQDQQVVSKSSVPNPVREMYNVSDKPPPLSILSAYRSASLTLSSDKISFDQGVWAFPDYIKPHLYDSFVSFHY